MIDRTELLQHALLGFQIQRQQIETQMEGLRHRLADAAPVEDRPKRRLSAKGRRSLIAATKKRWREAKKSGRRTLG